jgi:uncharacterized surface anchored protein
MRTLSAVVAATALALVVAGCSSARRSEAHAVNPMATTSAVAPTHETEKTSPPATSAQNNGTVAEHPAEGSSAQAAETQSTTSTNASAEPRGHQTGARLPKTASDRPLILLIGLCTLAAAGVFRFATRT